MPEIERTSRVSRDSNAIGFLPGLSCVEGGAARLPSFHAPGRRVPSCERSFLRASAEEPPFHQPQRGLVASPLVYDTGGQLLSQVTSFACGRGSGSNTPSVFRLRRRTRLPRYHRTRKQGQEEALWSQDALESLLHTHDDVRCWRTDLIVVNRGNNWRRSANLLFTATKRRMSSASDGSDSEKIRYCSPEQPSANGFFPTAESRTTARL